MKPIYLLDTNAVSELLKIAPNTSFLQQFTRYEKRCAIASTTWNELLFGVNIMESGKRRDFLFSKIIDEIQEAFPVIQLDNHAAWIQADLRARLKESGKKIDYPDTENRCHYNRKPDDSCNQEHKTFRANRRNKFRLPF